MTAIDPAAEYTKRLDERRQWRDRCQRLVKMLSYGRLAAGLLFFGSLWLAFVPHAFSGWFSLLPLTAYIVLVNYHERVKADGMRAMRAVVFYEQGLARIEDRWSGTGNTDTSFVDDSHLYAADLDLFGEGSLFELLCTARTRAGQETLARWLCAPATRSEILRRQEVLRELRDNVALREDLNILGPELREAIKPEMMEEWALEPPILESAAARIAAPFIAAVTVASLIYWAWADDGANVLRLAIAIQVIFALIYRDRVRRVMALAHDPAKELAVLRVSLERLEREHFSSEGLRELRARMEVTGKQATQEISRLVYLVSILPSQMNEMIRPFASILLWGTQVTFAVEAWRRRCGPVLGSWHAIFGEIEALCALAGYSFEHPGDPFPEILEGDARLEAEEVRHPLLPGSQCIPNSVRIGRDLQLLVISGSNMSGKSTLLRTVGINTVLAQAGAPVRAHTFKVTVVAIGATLRVQDSLQRGTSRFYAEIRRLHDIMELTVGSLPVLFLLDEILHGTNSHDRAIGAEAIVNGLIERGAMGFVTTHDLALAQVADGLAPRAANVHFQDHLENGKMAFDYRLHPGVVQKSNALELMRAVGLKV